MLGIQTQGRPLPFLKILRAAAAVGAFALLGSPHTVKAEAVACPMPEEGEIHKFPVMWQTSLEFYYYLPKSMRRRQDGKYSYFDDGKPRPLVVALHGCGQNALQYDNESGWRAVADAQDFILLFPSQVKSVGYFGGSELLMARDILATWTPANLTGGHFMGCFNFYGENSKRGKEEPAAIIAAVAAMTNCYKIKPKEIYVTGLSGGAAMTVVLAANYPDCFAGAAPLAGLPYGCSAAAAYGFNPISDCMDVDRGKPMRHANDRGPLARLDSQYRQAAAWGDVVRTKWAEVADRVTLPEHKKRTLWPTISAWQGSHDRVVAPGNLEAITMQWSDLHGATRRGLPVYERRGEYTIRRTEYQNGEGKVVLETRLVCRADARGECDLTVDDRETLPGTGHAVPISADDCGCKEDFIQDAGICSSKAIAEFWGLGADGKPPVDTRLNLDDYCEPIRKARAKVGSECRRAVE